MRFSMQQFVTTTIRAIFAGDVNITVADASKFTQGMSISISSLNTTEVKNIVSASAANSSIRVDSPMQSYYDKGALVKGGESLTMERAKLSDLRMGAKGFRRDYLNKLERYKAAHPSENEAAHKSGSEPARKSHSEARDLCKNVQCNATSVPKTPDKAYCAGRSCTSQDQDNCCEARALCKNAKCNATSVPTTTDKAYCAGASCTAKDQDTCCKVCTNDCQNGGTVSSKTSGRCGCICTPAYSGSTCQVLSRAMRNITVGLTLRSNQFLSARKFKEVMAKVTTGVNGADDVEIHNVNVTYSISTSKPPKDKALKAFKKAIADANDVSLDKVKLVFDGKRHQLNAIIHAVSMQAAEQLMAKANTAAVSKQIAESMGLRISKTVIDVATRLVSKNETPVEAPDGKKVEHEFDAADATVTSKKGDWRKPGGSCKNFDCKYPYAPKKEARCGGATCTEADRDICCEKRALCKKAMICNAAFVLKDQARCNGAICTAQDQKRCCERRALCKDAHFECRANFVLKTSNQAYCAGTSCAPETDRDFCCERRELCKHAQGIIKCDEHSFLKITEEAHCHGATCTDSAEDRQACCEKTYGCNVTEWSSNRSPVSKSEEAQDKICTLHFVNDHDFNVKACQADALRLERHASFMNRVKNISMVIQKKRLGLKLDLRGLQLSDSSLKLLAELLPDGLKHLELLLRDAVIGDGWCHLQSETPGNQSTFMRLIGWASMASQASDLAKRAMNAKPRRAAIKADEHREDDTVTLNSSSSTGSDASSMDEDGLFNSMDEDDLFKKFSAANLADFFSWSRGGYWFLEEAATLWSKLSPGKRMYVASEHGAASDLVKWERFFQPSMAKTKMEKLFAMGNPRSPFDFETKLLAACLTETLDSSKEEEKEQQECMVELNMSNRVNLAFVASRIKGKMHIVKFLLGCNDYVVSRNGNRQTILCDSHANTAHLKEIRLLLAKRLIKHNMSSQLHSLRREYDDLIQAKQTVKDRSHEGETLAFIAAQYSPEILDKMLSEIPISGNDNPFYQPALRHAVWPSVITACVLCAIACLCVELLLSHLHWRKRLRVCTLVCFCGILFWFTLYLRKVPWRSAESPIEKILNEPSKRSPLFAAAGIVQRPPSKQIGTQSLKKLIEFVDKADSPIVQLLRSWLGWDVELLVDTERARFLNMVDFQGATALCLVFSGSNLYGNQEGGDSQDFKMARMLLEMGADADKAGHCVRDGSEEAEKWADMKWEFDMKRIQAKWTVTLFVVISILAWIAFGGWVCYGAWNDYFFVHEPVKIVTLVRALKVLPQVNTTGGEVMGETKIKVANVTGLAPGMSITISNGADLEQKKIVNVSGSVVTFESPLSFSGAVHVKAQVKATSTQTTRDVSAGETSVSVAKVKGFSEGMLIAISNGNGTSSETKTIVGISSSDITFDSPLSSTYAAGSDVTAQVQVSTTAAVNAGESVLPVDDVSWFSVGMSVSIFDGRHWGRNFETKILARIATDPPPVNQSENLAGNSTGPSPDLQGLISGKLCVNGPLKFGYAAGAKVTSNFQAESSQANRQSRPWRNSQLERAVQEPASTGASPSDKDIETVWEPETVLPPGTELKLFGIQDLEDCFPTSLASDDLRPKNPRRIVQDPGLVNPTLKLDEFGVGFWDMQDFFLPLDFASTPNKQWVLGGDPIAMVCYDSLPYIIPFRATMEGLKTMSHFSMPLHIFWNFVDVGLLAGWSASTMMNSGNLSVDRRREFAYWASALSVTGLFVPMFAVAYFGFIRFCSCCSSEKIHCKPGFRLLGCNCTARLESARKFHMRFELIYDIVQFYVLYHLSQNFQLEENRFWEYVNWTSVLIDLLLFKGPDFVTEIANAKLGGAAQESPLE